MRPLELLHPPRDLAEEVAALEPQVVVVDPRHGPRILADRLRVEAEALDGSVAPARHRERPPVGLDEHGAVAVGAIDARADGAQPRERAGVWMAVQVARPDGDDGHRGPDGGEERRGTGRGGAVMADLEHRRAERDASLHGPPAPASTTTARPSGVSTTIASPWPTSSTVTRSRPSPRVRIGSAASAAAVSRASVAPAASVRHGPRRARQRHAASAPPSPAAYATTAPAPGAGRRITAPGTAAARAATARKRRSSGHTAPKAAAAARSPTAAASTASRPRTVAAPASGTAARVATTPPVESWLQSTSATGRP